jgi:hypothetical protein
LQQEVHTATQVKAEVHRQGMQRSQPLWRCGQQIQRNDVLRVGRVRIEGLFQNILGLQLGVRVFQASLDAVGVQLDTFVADAGGLQGFFDSGSSLGVDLDGDLGAGNLHGWRFTEEIGQGGRIPAGVPRQQ